MTEEKFSYEIRMAHENEWEDAMALAWKTFLQFEAGDYEPEGIRSFESFITDSTLYRMFVMGAYQMICAFCEGKMIGMITARGNTHISLLFVDEDFHRRGIGKMLIKNLSHYLRTELGITRITVNSSPYGVGFYHKVGFTDLEQEKTSEGIRFTPMELILE